MNLRIRPGELPDVPVIAELIRGLASYEKLEHEVVMTEEKLTASLFGERRYAETLIAEEDGEPIGFALFFHNYSTFLAQPGIYLEDLFVRPERRGGGVGRALLERLAQLAIERGCGRLEWAVLDWNVDAIRFYERLGARPNADWTVYRLTGTPLEALAAPAAQGAPPGRMSGYMGVD
ncbi:MAG TPA: GNAT family N-acetyltransferase, partial [Candidatus Dormibacteraeota bacterium]|nr:GNAT family N-acetyltransferase [Candidatus Dormibacteraeota bacterium]